MTNEPKYIQIREALRARSEAMSPGAKLPSVNTLHQELGVSQWTINRAIGELVADGVLELIPNRGAFVSRTRRQGGDIALVWPEIIDSASKTPLNARPYVSTIMHAVRVRAAELGRNLVVTPNADSLEPSFVSGDTRVAGLLIHFAPNMRLVKAYRKRGLPVVLLNPLTPMPGVPLVFNDDGAALFEATSYLIGLGHERIVHVAPERHLSLPDAPGSHFLENRISERRIRGYELAMNVAGLAANSRVYLWRSGSWEAQADAFVDTLEDARPTACCCFNDDLAGRAYRICTSRGISVPGDLSIVGHDGLDAASHDWSPLTTIQAPFARLGEAGVDMLDKMIEEKRLDGDGLVLSSRLLERSTTGAPRKSAPVEQRSALDASATLV